MIILSIAVMNLAAIVCVKAVYTHHKLSALNVVAMCPVLYNSCIRILGGIAFFTLVYIVAEIRWIAMMLNESTPELDEMTWLLIEATSIIIMYLTCDIISTIYSNVISRSSHGCKRVNMIAMRQSDSK